MLWREIQTFANSRNAGRVTESPLNASEMETRLRDEAKSWNAAKNIQLQVDDARSPSRSDNVSTLVAITVS